MKKEEKKRWFTAKVGNGVVECNFTKCDDLQADVDEIKVVCIWVDLMFYLENEKLHTGKIWVVSTREYYW